MAEQHYREALAVQEQVLGVEHPMTADTTQHLAALYLELGQYDRAKTWLDKALQRQEMAYGKEHSWVANTLNSLAHYYRQQGQQQEAIALYQQAIALVGDSSSGQIQRAVAWKGLGDMATHQTDYGEAEQYYQQAIDLVLSHYGAEHPNVAMLQASLAGIYQLQGNVVAASKLYSNAINLLGKLYGEDHPLRGEYLSDIGYLLSSEIQAHYWAKAAFEKAIAILSKFYEPNHPRMSQARRGLQLLMPV